MRSLSTRLLSVFLLTLLTVSCSKSVDPVNDPPPDPDPIPTGKSCRILSSVAVSTTNTATISMAYKYNADGKIVEAAYSGFEPFKLHFSYNGNMIYRAVEAGIHSYVDTITINDWGNISHIKEVTPQFTYYFTWEYNSAHEMIKYSSTQDSSHAPEVFTYTNSNGDQTGQLHDSFATTFEYDLDQPAVQGSLDDMRRLEFGAPYSTNKHLLIKIDNSQDHYSYSYTYTPEGNIATLRSRNNNYDGVTTHTYECK